MSGILQITDLNHRYSPSSDWVLRDICLHIDANEIVALFGESGSGKTTLLLAAGVMQRPNAGSVMINDRDVFQMSRAEQNRVRSSQIGYLFQTLQLVPYLNVLENVQAVQGVSREDARQWLARLGLSERLSHKPNALSQGERQRVALARAMVHRPALLIADEPTGNLDQRNSNLVLTALRDFANSGGAVLVATHDSMIESFADRVVELDSHQLVPKKVSVG